MSLGCSFLEMLVALSRRLAFQEEREPRDWFWEMMDNLGLAKHTDDYDYSEEEVNDILDRVIWRTYYTNGEGGLFPLRHASADQRHIELWYQMCAYLLERV